MIKDMQTITQEEILSLGVCACADYLSGNPEENKKIFDRLCTEAVIPRVNSLITECKLREEKFDAIPKIWLSDIVYQGENTVNTNQIIASNNNASVGDYVIFKNGVVCRIIVVSSNSVDVVEMEMSIKGENGKDGADGKNGKDGADGKNGKDGADGKNGKDGADGKNGKDGVSGLSVWVASVEHNYIVAEQTIEKSDVFFTEGRECQINDLILYSNGMIGKVVEIGDTTLMTEYVAIDLKPKRCVDYWTDDDKAEIVSEAVENITEKDLFIQKNQGVSNVGKILIVGSDGNLALTDIPQIRGDIIGNVDENNNIVLNGNLPDGTYVFKYENTDGTYDDIGTLVIGVADYLITSTLSYCTASENNPTLIKENNTATLSFTADKGYTLPDTVAVSGASYVWTKATGTLVLSNPTDDVEINIIAEKDGYTNIINSANCLEGYRLSVSTGETKAAEGYVISPMLSTLDYTKPITFYTEGVDFSQANCSIVLYNKETEAYISGNTIANLVNLSSWNGWSCSVEYGNLTLSFNTNDSSQYKFKICGMGLSDEFVMTANEEITR